MNAKMKACFTPHILMHSLVGLGLGLALATFIPALQLVWLGPLLVVVGVVFDIMRKD